tara:strand:- start:198 stop:1958 length:1761 start_codon:yes stop_codon:yes gene_type:complete
MIIFLSCSGGSGSEGSGGELFQSKTISNVFVLDLPTGKTYSDGENIDISLDHSQIISVSGAPRLTLTIGSTTKYADYLTGDDSRTIVFRYTVQSSDQDLDGIEINSQIDLNGGSLDYTYQGEVQAASQSFSLKDSSGIIVDTALPGPEITNFIEPFNGTYAEGAELLFQVNYEADVNITGNPRLALTVGSSTTFANYSSGDGSSSVIFSYTIQAGDDDSDGIALASNSIQLNGGSIQAVSDSANANLDVSSFLDSMASVIVNTSSGITAPDQVANLSTAPTTSNTTLALSWSVPNDNGTTISSYAVQYREQGSIDWTNLSPNPSSNSTSVSGLIEGTTYEFRVAANNGLLGPWSDVETAEIFDIASLSPIAWLSATSITNGGTEPTDGDKIASWEDLSGAASAATESDPDEQPIYEEDVFNGLPAVRFDALTRSLEGTFTRVSNNGLTVFIVAKMDANNPRKCLFEFYSDNGNQNDHRGFFFTYGMNEANTNHNLDDTTFNLWTAYDTGTHTDLWENGQVIYSNNQNWQGKSTAFTGAGAYVLGDDQTSGDQFNGYIAEFLIFDNQLSTSDREKVETYLKNKWGTP